MPPKNQGTFVGFGFGPIQAGLFALEAHRGGEFDRIVIAEVLPDVVTAVRGAAGRFSINVAGKESIETVRVGPVDLLNPRDPADRERLVDAIAAASVITTAIPSTRLYATDGDDSLHRILAWGLERRARRQPDATIVYTGENDNAAAEILRDRVLGEVAATTREQVRGAAAFVNTVIGKMSGVISDPDELTRSGLTPIAPTLPRAILVEAFNRILVSRPRFASGVERPRGIDVFEEKDDLLPFEEAKLWGHNAAHALAAYLAADRGLETMADVTRHADLLELVRDAFVEESGAALIRRHDGVDDLFTPAGFRAYVDDLLERMFNPLLGDRVDRVARDPRRKLGWHDRLVGPIRLALAHGIEPQRFAAGIVAAVRYLDATIPRNAAAIRDVLEELWRSEEAPHEEVERVLELVAATAR